MNHLAVSGILIFFTSTVLAVFVLSTASKRNIVIPWVLFSLCVAFWGIGLYKAFIADIKPIVLFWSRFLNLAALFIPLFFFNFVLCFTHLIKSKIKELKLYYLIYITYFLIVVIFPNLFIKTLKPILSFKYYPSPGILYIIFGALYTYHVVYSISLLLNDFKKSRGFRREQIKYLILGVTFGFAGGAMTFLPVYGIKIYPIGTYLVVIYIISTAYAIAKYRLMDIRIVVTRTMIFLLFYIPLLVIPFFIGHKTESWLWTAISAIIFSTVAPIIYNALKNKAEDFILSQQKHYQKILLQAAVGMVKQHDLTKLAKLMAYI